MLVLRALQAVKELLAKQELKELQVLRAQKEQQAL